jgi:hypothetical protein
MANDYSGCLRAVQTSGTNSPNNLSSAGSLAKAAKLRMVTVAYSGTATGSVTVTLTSGAGAGYSVALNTITLANNQGVFIPATPIPINADDSILVAAPAVASVTSSVAIYLDRSVMD